MPLRATAESVPGLQDRSWPPVPPHRRLSSELTELLWLPPAQQRAMVAACQHDPEAHGRLLHQCLGEVYAYLLGYRDGACHGAPDDTLEARLHQVKVVLERELLDVWLAPRPVPTVTSQQEAADHLAAVAAANPGVDHPLFDFLRADASREAVLTFLLCEAVRNEVVDDEVAWLVAGLQGSLKAATAANLWDECGRGRLRNFHTYWLRRLLEAIDGWDRLAALRTGDFPWFARITSNTLSMFLTRPPYKLAAYGCFLVFEGWVAPHFEKILEGMARVGLDDEDACVYFTAHLGIDPLHTRDLVDGVACQRPPLSPSALTALIGGAHAAVAAGTAQYDRMLSFLRAR
jgi:hypothetical protein